MSHGPDYQRVYEDAVRYATQWAEIYVNLGLAAREFCRHKHRMVFDFLSRHAGVAYERGLPTRPCETWYAAVDLFLTRELDTPAIDHAELPDATRCVALLDTFHVAADDYVDLKIAALEMYQTKAACQHAGKEALVLISALNPQPDVVVRVTGLHYPESSPAWARAALGTLALNASGQFMTPLPHRAARTHLQPVLDLVRPVCRGAETGRCRALHRSRAQLNQE